VETFKELQKVASVITRDCVESVVGVIDVTSVVNVTTGIFKCKNLTGIHGKAFADESSVYYNLGGKKRKD